MVAHDDCPRHDDGLGGVVRVTAESVVHTSLNHHSKDAVIPFSTSTSLGSLSPCRVPAASASPQPPVARSLAPQTSTDRCPYALIEMSWSLAEHRSTIVVTVRPGTEVDVVRRHQPRLQPRPASAPLDPPPTLTRAPPPTRSHVGGRSGDWSRKGSGGNEHAVPRPDPKVGDPNV